jgi:SpoIID/LytB domain protein
MMLMGTALAMMPSCETVNGVQQDLNPPASPSPALVKKLDPITFATEPDIRVRVAKGAVKKEVGGPATVIVRPVQTSSAAKSKVLKTPLTITTGPTGVTVVDGTHATSQWVFGTDLEVLTEGAPGSERTAQSIKVDKQAYPGYITIKGGWSEAPTRFDIIVTMPLETYLPGVVTSELLKDWPRQTNEAQAVAARTYALHERARARAEGRRVDVENTTDDQVYGGNASQVAIEAVRATRGMILVSEGKLLRAYFSSCCGGRPASAADVWPKTEEYEFNRAKPLQGKPRQSWCQNATLYRWEVTRSDEDVNKRIRAWGKATQNPVAGMARLRSVEVEETNEAHRPNHYTLKDDHGHEFMLKAEELRMALNHPLSDLPPITRENRVNSGDLEVEVWANQVRIHGRGWGHGVGMCQWCAKGMAEQGMDWNTMLTTFYPGVEIQKAY